jgi:hypothetical protein
MNIHSRSYPHQTRLAVPEYVRPPTTLFEHFQADPRGATTIGQWQEDRIWELLQQDARVEFRSQSGSWVPYSFAKTAALCIVEHAASGRWFLPSRIALLDGTVIKEWQ